MNYRLGLILFTLLLAVNLGKENNSPYVKRGLAAVDRSACIELVNGIMSVGSFDSEKAKTILRQLHLLHPDLTMAFLKQKVTAIEDDFMFYRSFVPYFYKKLELKLPELGVSDSLLSIKGKAIGDLHMDNFGALVKNESKLFYGVNDPDYANKIPMFSDALRYFTGLYLNNKKLKKDEFKKIVKAYYAGLKNDLSDVKTPKSVKKLSTSILSAPEDEISSLGKLVREVKKFRIPQELDSSELTTFKNMIEQKLGSSIEIGDSFKFMNVTGGSGGYMRYRFLIKLPTNSDFLPSRQIIELKEIPENLKLPFSEGEVGLDETIDTYFKIEDPSLRKFYGVLRGENTDFLMRPRWAELDFPRVSSMTGNKKQKFLEYQASLIGTYHRNSLQGSTGFDNYLGEIAELKAKSWREWSKVMAESINKDFKNLKSSE